MGIDMDESLQKEVAILKAMYREAVLAAAELAERLQRAHDELRAVTADRDAARDEAARFKAAHAEWQDKTEWVQQQASKWSVRYLGMHRADVMRAEMERLRCAPPVRPFFAERDIERALGVGSPHP